MMERCNACGRDGQQSCHGCESTSIEVGEIEILFNGYLAKSFEVCLCHECDGVWLRSAGDDRIYICSDCKDRALEVRLSETWRRKAS